jgi:bidirectional [NiFe] hydrogenase diaphorase subunit
MTREELDAMAATERAAAQAIKHHVHVCVAAGCLSSQSDAVLNALKAQVQAAGLDHACAVKGVGCLGLCKAGPLVTIAEPNLTYQSVTADDAAEIVDSLDAKPVERLLCPVNVPFFSRQTKITLENSGIVDPERLEEYVAALGYTALAHALTEMTPAQVVEEITASGLRGRGGAGYPSGLKWSTVVKAGASQGQDRVQKYVICNADEGDPGAFMDRSMLESDPHRVLEGMAIAGYAVGANQGYIYVRAEYPLAIKRLKKAIHQAERAGVLGKDIFGSEFSFHVELRIGAGAFVCGEETALIASIEGGRGMPRLRPPYPSEFGLWGKPTLINNVETYATVPSILRNGSAWFTKIGTDKSTGTKVFALAGTIQNTGLVEVPMGITLREIIYDVGGGIPNGKLFKAVQTGGPSGGCIPKEYLDTPVDYETLNTLGAIMGSGGMIVMDESSCMVDVARYFMEFCMTESCGKCIPCRVGTVQMFNLLTKICEGSATMDDLAMLKELCDMVRHTSLCGLGQSAPNPVMSTLRYFHDEYLAHIVEKRCPAGVCRMEPSFAEVTA